MKRGDEKRRAWRRAMMFNAVFGGLGGVVMMVAAAVVMR